jgi:regulator of nucleoside diphosphate kinase
MSHTPIYLSRDDHTKLRLLLTTGLHARASHALQKLRDDLDRAVVLDPAAIPSDVVTLDARVRFEDLGSNEVEEYTICFPDRANPEAGRLSILAPIGIALIGSRVGDIVNWQTPGGTRQLKVHAVSQPEPQIRPAYVVPAFSGHR